MKGGDGIRVIRHIYRDPKPNTDSFGYVIGLLIGKVVGQAIGSRWPTTEDQARADYGTAALERAILEIHKQRKAEEYLAAWRQRDRYL